MVDRVVTNDLDEKIQAEAEALYNVLTAIDGLANICEDWWAKQATDEDMADAMEDLVILVAVLRSAMITTWLEEKHGKH